MGVAVIVIDYPNQINLVVIRFHLFTYIHEEWSFNNEKKKASAFSYVMKTRISETDVPWYYLRYWKIKKVVVERKPWFEIQLEYFL